MKPVSSHKCYKSLCKLRTLKSAQRKHFIARAPTPVINKISELCLNCVKGSLPIDRREINLLKKDRTTIRAVGSKKNSLKKRRNLLIQKGGFLPILLKFALPLLASYIGSKLTKK